MDGNSLLVMVGMLVVSVMASLAVLWIAGTLMNARRQTQTDLQPELNSENNILIRNGIIADHDCNLSDALADITDWTELRAWFGARFPGLPEFLPDDTDETLTFTAVDTDNDPAKVTLWCSAGVARISLSDTIASQPADRHQVLRLQGTLSEDRSVITNSPCAVWKTDHDGVVFWQNDASMRLLNQQMDRVLDGIEIPTEPGEFTNSRVAIPQAKGSAQTWLDVHSFKTERFHVHYATDITNAVHAEAAQREFVQTLTKTFANLTTGLAIFDRNQQLALFNPALVDLTALPAEFLSSRPNLMSFFDNLRDRQVMPEPKSYSDWRAQISEMIKTASDGLYQENWSLPTGVTYRVTGRPHPDGAVAFLFEDISAEISLTRRFRAQNDLRQAVMDKLDHAVAVIAANNVVIFCNAVWTDLFGVDPDTSFAELNIRDLVAICRQKFPHPEFWQTVETQTTYKTLSRPIDEVIETDSDGKLFCRLVPVAGGAALICRPEFQTAKTTKAESVAS